MGMSDRGTDPSGESRESDVSINIRRFRSASLLSASPSL